MHFEEVFDIGFDYGAEGGQAWDTQVIGFPNGRSRRNQRRSAALGRWQLGQREIDALQLKQLQDFLHAMRGRTHSFLYKDWNDYVATDEQIVVDGASESQLIKSYGLSINGWIRSITKPKADSVVIEYDEGGDGGFVELEVDTDYTLDGTTGIVTWLLAPLPDSPDIMRWSGDFYVPVRFDRDAVSAQFLTYEDQSTGPEHAYQIGDLSVVEEPLA